MLLLVDEMRLTSLAEPLARLLEQRRKRRLADTADPGQATTYGQSQLQP